MVQEIAYIFGSVILVSIVSFIGVLSLLFTKRDLTNILLFLVSFSAGALLGDVIIHLLPEVVEEYGFSVYISLFVLLGIVIFFALEKFLHWR
ncbi:ZIP family metal transporter, partial [Candidatus Woesearchaeota archaeon]|nr:ZIP family metal transporter [Candidatus Woesearchaeota archaeon]